MARQNAMSGSSWRAKSFAILWCVILLSAAPALADTCYNCKADGDGWNCFSGGTSGGTGCSVNQNGCGVTGLCSGGSGGGGGIGEESLEGPVHLSFDRQLPAIARTHPSVAATLAKISGKVDISQSATIYWSPIEFEPADAARIAQGNASFEGRVIEGQPIVHQVHVERLEPRAADEKAGFSSFLVVRLSPVQLSNLERPFDELVMVFATRLADGLATRSSRGDESHEVLFWQID